MNKRWVLKLAGMEPPQYLTDWRTRNSCVWTLDIDNAESFVGAAEALDQARRISHVRGVPVEAVSVPQDEPGETCTTLHCGRPVEPGFHHCGRHLGMTLRGGGRPEPLTPEQEVEGALHMARQQLRREEAELAAAFVLPRGVASTY